MAIRAAEGLRHITASLVPVRILLAVCIWAELFEAGLSLNLVKYHGNLWILITLT